LYCTTVARRPIRYIRERTAQMKDKTEHCVRGGCGCVQQQ
jgi:hypothetical protein